MFIVYGLLDPRDTSMRYIGMTDDIIRRFIVHLRCTEVNRQKNAWVMELKAVGMIPMCRTLEVCQDERTARERERAWIDGFIEIGSELFNSEVTGKR